MDDISNPPHQGIISSCYDKTFASYYAHEKHLGAGGEGEVSLARVKFTGKTVVIKRLRLDPGTDLNTLRELVILDKVQKLGPHDNILRFYQIWNQFADPGECPQSRIILPYCPGGDLMQLRESFDRMSIKMTEAFIWHAYKQMLSGFGFLHENGISHRDIKPQNIMLDPVDFGDPALFPTIKIIDFGIAAETTEAHKTRDGTPKFQPPEAPIAGAKADVWAIGATIHLLATGHATKAQHPPGLSWKEVHKYYRKAPAEIHRIVDDADFDAGSLSLDEAREKTFGSLTPLPRRGYSALLEYYMNRALDQNASTRPTIAALNATLAEDADRQTDFYKAWFKQCRAEGSQRPMLTFSMLEPHAGWTPPTEQ